jgi:hypothetical protein
MAQKIISACVSNIWRGFSKPQSGGSVWCTFLAALNLESMKRDVFPAPRLGVTLTNSLLATAHERWQQGQLTDSREQVTATVFKQLLVDAATYYVLYEHPIHSYLNRAYQTDGQQLRVFLAERLNPKGGVGLDLWILSLREHWLLACTHDNDIYAIMAT